MPTKDMAGIREKCDQIWQFRMANAGAKPRRRSDDAEEAQLGRFLDKLRMRAKGNIGEGRCSSDKELSSADKDYLRNTLVEPMPTASTAGVTGAGAHAEPKASTAREIGEKVLQWQASQGCQRIPNARSHNEIEKKLGRHFDNVLRRRYCTKAVSYTHLRAHETPEHLGWRLLL